MVIKDALRIEKESAGMPIGVQIVGRHWREDQVLTTMKALEMCFRKTDQYPLLPIS